jgi:trigger factor
MFRQLQMNGIDPQAWMSATGQGIDETMEGTRPQAEQAVKADLALRAVAAAEGIEASDADIEMEYARMAMQYGQKAKDIRRAYEQNDAVPELLAQIRKSKAMDWLLHHVEMVDHEGKEIDRDLVLGHTHDHDDDDHDHDHDHDHADDVADENESE